MVTEIVASKNLIIMNTVSGTTYPLYQKTQKFIQLGFLLFVQFKTTETYKHIISYTVKSSHFPNKKLINRYHILCVFYLHISHCSFYMELNEGGGGNTVQTET